MSDNDTSAVAEDGQLAQAYVYLQRIVGVIAVTLPFVLAVADWLIEGQEIRGSISAYYYGRPGSWFVGCLFALAVFFLSYDYRPRPDRIADNWLSNVASVMAIGVALFPTPSNGSSATGGAQAIGTIHLLCAAVLFVLLAVFSLYQFTKTRGEVTSTTTWGEKFLRLFRTEPRFLERMSPRKRSRNRVYRACGWVIVLCIIGVIVNNIGDLGLLFWFESVAVMAFGISWLVKGGAIASLND